MGFYRERTKSAYLCVMVWVGRGSLLAASSAQQTETDGKLPRTAQRIETDGKATSCGAALHGSPTKLQMTFRDLDGCLGLLAALSR